MVREGSQPPLPNHIIEQMVTPAIGRVDSEPGKMVRTRHKNRKPFARATITR